MSSKERYYENHGYNGGGAENGNTPQHGEVNSPGKNKGFWEKRTSLEKALMLLCAVVLVALIVVVILLAVEKESEPSAAAANPVTGDAANVCISKECVSAAARIDSYIDYSVEPCDDLYQFACGRWMKENVIPEDRSSWNTFGVLRDKVSIVLKNLLEEEATAEDIESVKKAKDLYASCLNKELIEERGDGVLKELLHDQFGGWPLVSAGWVDTTFEVVDTMAKLNQISSYPMVTFYTGVDNKNSSVRTLKMDQPSFGMPGQKYYLVERNETMLMAYEDLIYGVGQLMGFADPATAREEVKAIVDFEIFLANISVPDEERRDSNALYNPYTLAQVQGNYSQILNFNRYVDLLMAVEGVDVTDVTQDEIIINQSPPYFNSLIGLLSDTPKRTVANYLMWRAVLGMLGTMGEDYQELYKIYTKALYGTTSDRADFYGCSSYTTSYLGLAVGKMFIKENFDEDAKAIALEMIDGLQEAFNQLLTSNQWMDEATKELARDKNEYIKPFIGYADQVLNDTYVNELYSKYTYDKDKYFENVLENKRESFVENMKQLRDLVDKDKWDDPPSTVNAFYSPSRNQILFPAGILQPPFFSKTYPKSLNYGGIGVVIGHEITHGFDDRGRQYDKIGNLVQWWSDEVAQNFKAKAQCIVDQYSNFTVEEIGMNLNGVNTQGENIADNGGLKQAFKAYRNYISDLGREEPQLPGLGFSHNQLFFINFAQLWCILMREEDALSRIRTGVHSPGRFRVIGSTQNSPDFAEAFNCKAGDYMHPTPKCNVW